MFKANVRKPKLIVFCALGALLDVYPTELKKRLPNSVLLRENTLTEALLDVNNHTTLEYQAVKKNIHKALNELALEQLKDGNDVILHGYYGDKLTQPGTIEYILPELQKDFADYDVRVMYLHCSAAKHSKYNDKRDDKYKAYRIEHIRNHLRELSKLSDVLLLDVESDANFDANMKKIENYINDSVPALKIIDLSANAASELAALTLEHAYSDFNVFKNLLGKIKGVAPNFYERYDSKSNNMTYLYGTLAVVGVGVLALAAYAAGADARTTTVNFRI